MPGWQAACMMPLNGLEITTQPCKHDSILRRRRRASLARAAQAAQLRRLALYFDVGAALWRPKAAWAAMPRGDWDGLFQPGIAEGPSAGAPSQPQIAAGEATGDAPAAGDQGRAEEQRPTEESSPVMQACEILDVRAPASLLSGMQRTIKQLQPLEQLITACLHGGVYET